MQHQVALAALVVSLVGCADDGAAEAIADVSEGCPSSGVLRGPWAQKPTETSITLRWDGCAEGDARVVVHAEPVPVTFEGTRSRHEVRTRYDAPMLPDRPGTHWLHEVVVDGLRPGTCYTYELAADPERGGRFCTARRSGQPFSFWAVGDTNPIVGPTEAIVERFVAHEPDFTLHLGDIQYYTDGDTWAHWFVALQPMLSAGAFLPSRGNHESELEHELEDYYLRLFADAGDDGGERTYYRFQSGGLHFFALDTQKDLDIGSDQGGWLEAGLAEAAASEGFRGSIVFMHKPLLSIGPAPTWPHLRAHYGPIFAEHGVRLALAGHVHGYERFLCDDGVVWVTSGGGGGALGDVDENMITLADDAQLRVFAAKMHHAVLFEVGEETLVGTAFDPEGRALDGVEVRIPPARSHATPAR